MRRRLFLLNKPCRLVRYKYKLKKNGVRIFYAKETIPDGPEGINTGRKSPRE